MLIIIVSHHAEARALIETFELKQLREFSAKQVYGNQSMRLAISGIGSVNAAIATTLALSSVDSSEPLAALNFGICAAKPVIPIGSLCCVHSIRAAASGRNFYPDMILDLKVAGFSLETRECAFDRGKSAPITSDIIDMEAAGYFEAARSFIPPSRIFLLKVVSDHGGQFSEFRELLPELLSKHTPDLRKICNSITGWIAQERELSAQVASLLPIITDRLKLTETQYQRILFLCRARRYKTDTEQILAPFMTLQYTHRQQRSSVFSELVDALAISQL